MSSQKKGKKKPNPNNFRDFQCDHRHRPWLCKCSGNHCSHISCWIKERYKDLRVGYGDIETTQLKADFGYLLSYVFKVRDKNKYFEGTINKSDIDHASKRHEAIIDKRLVQQAVNDLRDNFDYVIFHYGAIQRGLDVRFLRTRATIMNIDFPKQREMFTNDTYPIARNKFLFHSNRLDSIAKGLKCPIQKTELSPEHWILGGVGDLWALKYIHKHNKRDVQVLEWVHKKLEGSGLVNRTSI